MACPTELGKRLKAFRMRAGMSRKRLSEVSGVPRPTITNVELGNQVSMSLDSAFKIADALGITVDVLRRGDPLGRCDK